jgi:hypothetical protein
MIQSVKKLQKSGLIVSGGFIVGFDNDPLSIFEQQISFIQKSGIVTAMVGLLNAQPGTRLFQRLRSENRIINDFSGDNMDGSINFIPRMNLNKLIFGYKAILQRIYSPKQYYNRIKTFLREYRHPRNARFSISVTQLMALVRSFWVLGVLDRARIYYWKFVIYCLFRFPEKFDLAVTMAIYGFHFRSVIKAA